MPRLTKKQAIDYYGRNLPTPTIEKITLSDVKEDDELYEALDGYTRLEGEDLDISAILTTMTRIDVDVSFYFSTWEGFDADGVGDDLFSTLTSAITSDAGIYITLQMNTEAPTVVDKAQIVSELDQGSVQVRERVRSHADGSLDYNDVMHSIIAVRPGAPMYTVSVPLSDFFEVAELTPEQDIDGNPVIRFTNIKVTTYVKNFADKDNIRLFCCTSTKHPFEIRADTGAAMDATTVAINYSDITYEDVLNNGMLATFGEPIYVDNKGTHYPQMPISGLNKLYYKTDSFGTKQITDSLQSLISEYAERIPLDEELENAVGEVNFIINTYERDVSYLLNLNKMAQGLSVTNTDSKGIIFTERLRILINNIDAMLTRQEQVVKRVYRNYKIVDSRAILLPDSPTVSYVPGLHSEDFLYRHIYNTNIANYVPMTTAGSAYPGKSELPYSPSERTQAFSSVQRSIRSSLESLLRPVYYGFSYEGIADFDDIAASPGSIEYAAAYAARHLMASQLNNAATQLTDWAFDVWAANFIGGSAHPAYQGSDEHAGAHYYIAGRGDGYVGDYEGRSSDWNNSGIYSKGNIGTQNERGLTGRWESYFILNNDAPLRFWNMVYNTSPTATRSHLRSDGGRHRGDSGEHTIAGSDTQGVFVGDSYSHDIDRYDTLYDGSDRRGGPERYSGDPETTLRRFGYYPSAHSDRPDNSPPYAHPSLIDYHNWYPYAPVEGEAQHVYFDPYFWTAVQYDELWSMYCLGQLDEQIEVFVPKRYAPFSADSKLLSQNSLIDPDDYITPEAATPPGAPGSGIPPEARATLSSTSSDEARRAQGHLLEDILNYRDNFFEKIGGIKCLHSNTIDTAAAREAHELEPDSRALNELVVGNDTEGNFANIAWWRCARIRKRHIRASVDEMIQTAYGIHYPSGMSTAGMGALDHPYEGEEYERGDTNPLTEMDAYIAEGPARITEAALSEILGEIDSMSTESIADFDTPNERENWADIFRDRLITSVNNKIEAYYNVKLCKIYAVTAMPDRMIYRNTMGSATQSAFGAALHKLDYKHAVGRNRGTDPYPSIPFGYWNLPYIIRGPSYNPDTDEFHYFSGDTASDTAFNEDYFEYNFAADLQTALKSYVNRNKDEIREKLLQYITLRAQYAGFESDTGIHSALSEVDIVLNKYGYFFFDMEKYIRKNSYLSKVMNVDRFLTNFQDGRQMTNAGCRFKEAEVTLRNFDEHPDGRHTGGEERASRARLILQNSEESALDKSNPSHFKRLDFFTPINAETGVPYVYRKINALNGISFDQITEYTHNRATDMTITPDTPSMDLEGGAVGGGYGGGSVGGGGGGSGTAVVGTTAPTTVPGSSYGTAELGSDPMMPTVTSSDTTAGGLEARLGEGRTAQQQDYEQIAARLARQEVDIDDLVLDDLYAPKELNTHLVMRNYAFPGFRDAALSGGKKWRFDYRMMMFKYQFFMDDDYAFSYTGDDGEFDDGISSVDDIKIKVTIIDESKKIFYALVRHYTETFKVFMTEYVEFAEEACAFDSFSQSFNKFFVDQMLNMHPGAPDTPWHKMIVTYVTFVNFMSDHYGGDSIVMFRDASNLMELIRPETGNLQSLRNFVESCEGMLNRLKSAQTLLEDDLIYGEDITEFHYTYIDPGLAAPVIDHIGDYTAEETDPEVLAGAGVIEDLGFVDFDFE